MPLEYLPGYGAGIQVHVEDLAAYIGGGERCDSDARMGELFPAYHPRGERRHGRIEAWTPEHGSPGCKTALPKSSP